MYDLIVVLAIPSFLCVEMCMWCGEIQENKTKLMKKEQKCLDLMKHFWMVEWKQLNQLEAEMSKIGMKMKID